MKKSVFFLTLLLCLSLIFPGAHAEDTYVPGERMRSLVSSALEAGQLVGGEAHFSLTLPDSMLPDDEEGRAQFDALAEVIQGVSLAGGMGRPGRRLPRELAALTPRHPATTSTSPARPT